jgi:N-acetylneuraminate synthase/N,N'-diacetyllegionaminate synthase
MADFFADKFPMADKVVGLDQPVFIVAEAGVAHFGSLEKAFRLVDLAVQAKADAVKFQMFKTDELIADISTEWRERLRPKELPLECFKEIQSYCRERNIIFFATAHDRQSLDYLSQMDVPAYKIGSGEVENWPFIQLVAEYGRPVIISTGMYELDHVGQALEVFQKAGNHNVAVLHCVTQYPAPPASINLRVMETIGKRFQVLTGYSDHTQGFHIPLAAVALGARIIEKHISLDFNVPNAQDWKVSCGPHDLHLMIQQIRDIEVSLGSWEKQVTAAETASLEWARKSLVACRDIEAGEILNAAMINTKRPGTGISPAMINDIIGKRVITAIKCDQLILWEHLV